MNRLARINLVTKMKKNNFLSLSLRTFSSFTEQLCSMTKGSGIKRGRPDSFIGDIQEVFRLSPRNFNIFFFSWSISCRLSTALLCLLLI